MLELAQKLGVSLVAPKRHAGSHVAAEEPKRANVIPIRRARAAAPAPAAPPAPSRAQPAAAPAPAPEQLESAKDLARRLADSARDSLRRLETDDELSGRDRAALMNACKGSIALLGAVHGRASSGPAHRLRAAGR